MGWAVLNSIRCSCFQNYCLMYFYIYHFYLIYSWKREYILQIKFGYLQWFVNTLSWNGRLGCNFKKLIIPFFAKLICWWWSTFIIDLWLKALTKAEVLSKSSCLELDISFEMSSGYQILSVKHQDRHYGL